MTEADRTQWSLSQEIEGLAQTFSLGKILLSLLIFMLGYLANKLVKLLVARAGRGRNIYVEGLRRFTPFVRFGLWFAVVLVIVQIFTHSPLAIILLITVAALALAFASQLLLRDLLGGLVILFERLFRIGDRITIGDHRGEVKEIGLRAFHLASSDGALIAVPNAAVLVQSVANTSPGMSESMVTMELSLPDGCEMEQAKRIAFEAAAVSPFACIHKPIEVFFDEKYQNEPHPRIIVRAYVFDAKYERQLRSDTAERARRGYQNLRRAAADAPRLPD